MGQPGRDGGAHRASGACRHRGDAIGLGITAAQFVHRAGVQRLPAVAGNRELREREVRAGTAHALADDQAYASVCEQIRSRGLHFVHGLLMPGVDALSAPVFNAVGHVAAVMTVVGPTSLFHADEDGPAAQRLLAATRAVSWRMGYQP